jgi:hypothetical protein
MGTGLTKLIERMNRLPETEQERYAEEFLTQLDEEDEFDVLITSRPDVFRALAEEALAEHRAGKSEVMNMDEPC